MHLSHILSDDSPLKVEDSQMSTPTGQSWTMRSTNVKQESPVQLPSFDQLLQFDQLHLNERLDTGRRSSASSISSASSVSSATSSPRLSNQTANRRLDQLHGHFHPYSTPQMSRILKPTNPRKTNKRNRRNATLKRCQCGSCEVCRKDQKASRERDAREAIGKCLAKVQNIMLERNTKLPQEAALGAEGRPLKELKSNNIEEYDGIALFYNKTDILNTLICQLKQDLSLFNVIIFVLRSVGLEEFADELTLCFQKSGTRHFDLDHLLEAAKCAVAGVSAQSQNLSGPRLQLQAKL